LAALDRGDPVQFPPLEMVQQTHDGVPVQFFLNMERDPVQNIIRSGQFYEIAELRELEKHIKNGAHIIDIGSNIGNHLLYFAKIMRAARIVPVEPNPLALAPLMAAILGNDLTDIVEFGALGVGLSDQPASGFGMKRHDRNLGATKMFEGRGDIEVHRGDDLFVDETPDLIKIDVEGMELKVLRGLEQLVARAQPVLIVEVDDANLAGFDQWLAQQAYQTIWTRRVSKTNGNHLAVPRSTAQGHA